MAVVYVNTDVAAGGTGTQGNPYGTWAEALTPFRLAGVASTPLDIMLSGSTPDPGVSGLGSAFSLDHSAWEFVTSPTNKIRVFGNNTGRKWDTSKYRVHVTNRAALYNQYAAHVELYNIQIQVKITDAGDYLAYRLSTANNDLTNGAPRFYYKNCIARKDPTSTNGKFRGWFDSISGSGLGGGSMDRADCLVIGITGHADEGFGTDDGAWVRANCKTYNSAVAKCNVGYDANAITKNSWAKGCVVGFTGTIAGTDYCAEDDGNGVPGGGTHNKTSVNYASPGTFVDAANDDYGIAATDTILEGAGLNNPGSGLFLDTIDGKTRNGTWSIGPTQFNATTPVTSGLMTDLTTQIRDYLNTRYGTNNPDVTTLTLRYLRENPNNRTQQTAVFQDLILAARV